MTGTKYIVVRPGLCLDKYGIHYIYTVHVHYALEPCKNYVIACSCMYIISIYSFGLSAYTWLYILCILF